MHQCVGELADQLRTTHWGAQVDVLGFGLKPHMSRCIRLRPSSHRMECRDSSDDQRSRVQAFARGAALLEPVANKYFRAQRNKVR